MLCDSPPVYYYCYHRYSIDCCSLSSFGFVFCFVFIQAYRKKNITLPSPSSNGSVNLPLTAAERVRELGTWRLAHSGKLPKERRATAGASYMCSNCAHPLFGPENIVVHNDEGLDITV